MSNCSTQRQHAALTVQVGARKENIDEEIAPLSRELWLAGIETAMSCQEDGWGFVWIMLPEEADLIAFLNMVAEYEAGTDSLYNRMSGRWREPGQAWDYEILPWDSTLCGEDGQKDGSGQEHHDGKPDFFFDYSVRFPPCDLSKVLDRMKRHNRREPVAE